MANGAKYGMLTNDFYWIGAIPSMVFLGIFLMPFYCKNDEHSVPEYLRLRLDKRAHMVYGADFWTQD